MKDIRQPLSEDFVYGSPERIPAYSYRWIPAQPRPSETKTAQRKGEGDGGKQLN
ncbi:MAG: hypothetical protein P8101_17390 [Candidatus Thiodiazotropha sp.]|jgi:hypothetical protein